MVRKELTAPMSQTVSGADQAMPPSWQRWSVALLVIAASVLPFAVAPFVLFQVTVALTYAIAILGLNLLTGFNGQFSLGHSTFYAIGAYTAAILIGSGSIDYYWTIPIAGAVCFAFGFLFGLPALRLDGIYLALATFALAIATPQILKLTPVEPWTGGVQGLVVERPAPPSWVPLDADQWLYFVTAATGLLLAWTAINLVDSRSGRAMIAIRDHPIAARAMGINVALYKPLAFGTSALYAGIGGALSAMTVQFVAPDSFTFVLAIGLFVGMVVGGVGSVWGALPGGLFLLFVPNMAETVSKGLAGAVYGVILILVIYLMPSGVAGMVRLAARKLVAMRRSHGNG